MIQEGGEGGKAKLKANLTPFSELLPAPQGEETKKQGEPLKSGRWEAPTLFVAVQGSLTHEIFLYTYLKLHLSVFLPSGHSSDREQGNIRSC